MKTFKILVSGSAMALICACSPVNFLGNPGASSGGNNNGNPGSGATTVPNVTTNPPVVTTNPTNPTPPIGNSGGSGCSTAVSSDNTPLVNLSGFFGRPVEIIATIPDNVNYALHACESWATIIDGIAGNGDPSLSLGSTCTHYEDVMEIQFNFSAHGDQLQKSGDYVEYCESLPMYAGWNFVINNDMSITAPDDCVTKSGFVNYYAGSGLQGYVIQAECNLTASNAAALVVRITKP